MSRPEEVIYLNGELVPHSQAAISPFDHGFLYGYGVFDTLRTYGGRFFRLKAHLGRLYNSLGVVGLACPLNAEGIQDALYKTIRANGLDEARVRLTVSAGEGEAAPEPLPTTPTVLITAHPLTPISESANQKGYSAVIAGPRTNSSSPLCGVKSCNYLGFLLAQRQARGAGAQEALLLNEKGHLTEGTFTNLFLVKDGTLITTDLASGPLPGITRGAVLELAWVLGVAVAERPVNPSELAAADEAFLTSSVLEVMPLTQVDGRPVGGGGPGRITKSLMAAYRDAVRRETARSETAT
ncbi:MAG: aminotransferase class IV [Dehalococcoidia bacterium]|nr:aminotransferase class IV [Dehalococcoidia bacterium]